MLADLSWPAVVGITALAWAIAAVVEWLAWQSEAPWPRRPAPGLPGAGWYPRAPYEPSRDVYVLPPEPHDERGVAEPSPSREQPVEPPAPAPDEDEPARPSGERELVRPDVPEPGAGAKPAEEPEAAADGGSEPVVAPPVEEPEPAKAAREDESLANSEPVAADEPEPTGEPEPFEAAPVQEEGSVEPAEPVAAHEPEPTEEPEPVETEPAGEQEPPSAPTPDLSSGSPPAQPEETADPSSPAAPRGRRSWLGGLRRRSVQSEPTKDESSEAAEPPSPEPEREAEPQPRERAPLRAVERPVEPSPPVPEPAQPDLAETSVVRLSSRRAAEPREWNLWDLESVAREESRADPSRRDEWSYLFLHLRQFADAQGTLPAEFDGLVRESFGDLLEIHDLV